MNSKQKTLSASVAAIAVVAVVAVAVFAPFGGEEPEEVPATPSVYFNYELSTMGPFVTFVGQTVFPGTGNVFVLAKIAVKNVDYEGGINGDSWDYKLNVDGVSYNGVGIVGQHPLYNVGEAIIMVGEKGMLYNMWIMPADIDLSKATVVWEGDEDIIVEYDPDLI